VEKQSVLLVDDHPENLVVLEQSLDGLGLDLIKATSGNDALAIVLERDLALVLLDVQMPGMDGYEMAELMRQFDKSKYIPIIFVTAIDVTDQQVFKGYESGAVDFLFKPIVPEILRSKVSVFADLHRQKLLIEQQVEEIKTLRGILPVCSHCKKVRNDLGGWDDLEVYVRQHSEATFSHGICDPCLEEHYPDLDLDVDIDVDFCEQKGTSG
jgi:CheY-like chemotaxis protein|tara:strand:+ start:17553 stop:18185 length:633 start_codon:yes stop_codon:yes gene_type:complete